MMILTNFSTKKCRLYVGCETFFRLIYVNKLSKTRASFVLPAKAVHENQYGKGLWAKIPADGHTTLTKPYLAGQSEDGKNIWSVKVGDNVSRVKSTRENIIFKYIKKIISILGK